MVDLIVGFLTRYGDGFLIGAGLIVLAGCQWYLMRREPPRRANRLGYWRVNGVLRGTIAEAEEASDWSDFCGVKPHVEFLGVEAEKPAEAAKAAGGQHGPG